MWLHHLRWSSGAISASVMRLLPAFGARATVCRVSFDASGPSAFSTSAAGSTRACASSPMRLATSSRCGRPSIHALCSSAKPFGDGGRQSGSPRVGVAVEECGAARARRRSRACRDQPLARALEFRRASTFHVSGASISAFAISFRSPSVSRKRFGQPLHQRRRAARRRTKCRASLRAMCAAVAGCAQDRPAPRGPAPRRPRRRSCPASSAGPARAGAD